MAFGCWFVFLFVPLFYYDGHIFRFSLPTMLTTRTTIMMMTTMTLSSLIHPSLLQCPPTDSSPVASTHVIRNVLIFTHKYNLLEIDIEDLELTSATSNNSNSSNSTDSVSLLEEERRELHALQNNVRRIIALHRFLTNDNCLDSIRHIFSSHAEDTAKRDILSFAPRPGQQQHDRIGCPAQTPTNPNSNASGEIDWTQARPFWWETRRSILQSHCEFAHVSGCRLCDNGTTRQNSRCISVLIWLIDRSCLCCRHDNGATWHNSHCIELVGWFLWFLSKW